MDNSQSIPITFTIPGYETIAEILWTGSVRIFCTKADDPTFEATLIYTYKKELQVYHSENTPRVARAYFEDALETLEFEIPLITEGRNYSRLRCTIRELQEEIKDKEIYIKETKEEMKELQAELQDKQKHFAGIRNSFNALLEKHLTSL